MNERIRAREVRVIDEQGNQVGILPVRQALEMARQKGLDLVEVAPTANPPVCRIMDYGRYKYEQSKREREARKKQHVIEVKGIRMRPQTDEHDYQFKLRNIRRFLQDGNKVKVTVVFKSREITHPEIARRSLDRLAKDIEDLGIIEQKPEMEGRTMVMVIGPKARTGSTSGDSSRGSAPRVAPASNGEEEPALAS